MTAWRSACLIALLSWQQAPPPPQTPAPAPPSSGVYQVRDVDVPPHLVREVKPNYTGDAIRARIQGVVTLSCVVLADGSVGDVRVTKSLDATYGLDEQAIIAMKQWRFSPAMKAGSPVPIVVNAELSFTLKDGAAAAPALKWPDGFDAPLDAALESAEWREDTFEVVNLRIKIAYPPGWTLARSPNERTMFALQKAGEMSTLFVSPPQPAPVSLDRPLTAEELRRFAEFMTGKAADQGMKVDTLGFGQAPAASHTWAWQAFKMASFATPNMTPAMSAVATQMYDGGLVWEFQGTRGNHGLTIFCITGIPRRLSDAERASLIHSSAAVYGEILRRMSISVVQ